MKLASLSQSEHTAKRRVAHLAIGLSDRLAAALGRAGELLVVGDATKVVGVKHDAHFSNQRLPLRILHVRFQWTVKLSCHPLVDMVQWTCALGNDVNACLADAFVLEAKGLSLRTWRCPSKAMRHLRYIVARVGWPPTYSLPMPTTLVDLVFVHRALRLSRQNHYSDVMLPLALINRGTTETLLGMPDDYECYMLRMSVVYVCHVSTLGRLAAFEARRSFASPS